MTTKEKTVLDFWFGAVWSACQKNDRYVSAGEVGRMFGYSRTTAQKYMQRLVKEKVVVTSKEKGKNKVTATLYAPTTGWS